MPRLESPGNCVYLLLGLIHRSLIPQGQVIVQPNDVPIRIFHPTIAISNAILSRTLQKSTKQSSQQQQQHQLQLQQRQSQYLHQKRWS